MATLSDAGRTQIESTIAELEQRTAAELVVVELGQSGSYSEIKLGYALAVALLAGGVGHWLWPETPYTWLLWLQLGAALVALLLLSLPVLLRALVPRGLLTQSVEQRAKLAFLDHEVFATRDRTGVLILLSLLERRVVILGDTAIHAKVQGTGWQGHVDHIVKAIHAGRTAEGVCETLRAVGEILTVEFPVRPDDVDELSNKVRQR